MPETKKLIVIVPRDSREEITFAVITCRETPDIHDRRDVREALDAALREYFRTPEGRRALERSSDDFNVGDLINELYGGNDGLDALLKARGLLDLDVETFSEDADPHDWTFDERLGDEDVDEVA